MSVYRPAHRSRLRKLFHRRRRQAREAVVLLVLGRDVNPARRARPLHGDIEHRDSRLPTDP